MNNKILIGAFLLIIIGLFLIVFTKDASKEKNNSTTISNNTEGVSQSPKEGSPETPSDIPANWKTYDYSFISLSLPPDWHEERRASDFIQLLNYDLSKAPQRGFDPTQDKGLLKIEISKQQTSLSLEEYVSQQKKASSLDGGVWNETKVQLDGSPAIKVKSSNPGFSVYSKNTSNSILYIGFLLDFDNYSNLANQILSTIKLSE